MKNLTFFSILFLCCFGVFSDDSATKQNGLSTSFFPFLLQYERCLTDFDSISLKYSFPLLFEYSVYRENTNKFLFEYRRYIDSTSRGVYFLADSGYIMEERVPPQYGNIVNVIMAGFLLKQPYYSRFNVGYVPIDVGVGAKSDTGPIFIDLNLMLEYDVIVSKSGAYEDSLAHQGWQIIFNPQIGFMY